MSSNGADKKRGEIQYKLFPPSFPQNTEKQESASPWELAPRASRKPRFITPFLMVNLLIRELTLPMPLVEGCAVSRVRDVSYGNATGSPRQGAPPEERALIEETLLA